MPSRLRIGPPWRNLQLVLGRHGRPNRSKEAHVSWREYEREIRISAGVRHTRRRVREAYDPLVRERAWANLALLVAAMSAPAGKVPGPQSVNA
jgi:hypothetical protein